jgi:hypothetical protein
MPAMVKVKGENFCDSLGKMSLRYVVLTKEDRVQILVNPTQKQLRKRGKRQWRLVQAIDGEPDARKTLQEIVMAVVHDMEADTNGEAV